MILLSVLIIKVKAMLFAAFVFNGVFQLPQFSKQFCLSISHVFKTSSIWTLT